MAKLVYLDNIERMANTVVTVGTFDGVHKGHHSLIKTVVNKAKSRNARSVVITFDPHPREIINPGKSGIKLLTTLQERAEIMNDIGVDVLLVIPFTRDFSLLSSEEFVRDVVYKKIGISEFVIGYDHQFGRDREGSIDTIKKLGKELGYDAAVISRQEMGNTTISSTLIRKTIALHGNVKLAAEYLGRHYMLNGIVVHGDKRGREMGFPTANIQPEHENKVIPETGVYAVKVRVNDTWYGGMMSIGYRPTFGNGKKTLEVNIFDFNQDIYGKTIQIRFVDRLRDELKFGSIETLTKAMEKDKELSLQVLKNI